MFAPETAITKTIMIRYTNIKTMEVSNSTKKSSNSGQNSILEIEKVARMPLSWSTTTSADQDQRAIRDKDKGGDKEDDKESGDKESEDEDEESEGARQTRSVRQSELVLSRLRDRDVMQNDSKRASEG